MDASPTHRARFWTLLLALAACLVTGAPSARAAELPASEGGAVYVDPAGDDDAPGTAERPLRTVSAGLERARPGERVLLRTGVYPDWAEGAPRGTARAPITVAPAPGARPVITHGFKLNGAAYVRVAGLTFDGATNPAGFGTSIWRSHHVEFARNTIRGYGRPGGSNVQGILINDGASDIRLIGNDISDLGAVDRHDHGIYCASGRRVVIANNVIRDMRQGYGVHLFGDCDGVTIVHNTIFNSMASGVTIGGNDERGTADRVLVAGNIVAGHRNEATGDQGWAVTTYQPGRGVVVRDNLLWDNARGTDADEQVSCAGCRVSRNVAADPRFLDVGRRDFRLRAGSPALMRAGNLEVDEDFSGRRRPRGAADLGALQRTTARAARARVGRD